MSNKKWSDNILVLRVHCLCLIMGFITCWSHFKVSLSPTEWMKSRGVRSKKTGLTYMFSSHLQNHYHIHCAVFAVMEHKNMYSIVYNSRFSWETCNNITLETFKIKSHGFLLSSRAICQHCVSVSHQRYPNHVNPFRDSLREWDICQRSYGVFFMKFRHIQEMLANSSADDTKLKTVRDSSAHVNTVVAKLFPWILMNWSDNR